MRQGLPAEVGVVLAERALVLQVQLCSALGVQRAEHLDQNVFQDGWPWGWNKRKLVWIGYM